VALLACGRSATRRASADADAAGGPVWAESGLPVRAGSPFIFLFFLIQLKCNYLANLKAFS
jgi:hypothetical protein